jgi:hypothetical protein
MAGAAALEVAVHGWDTSLACGQRQPIPRALATGLLAIARCWFPAPAATHCSRRRSPWRLRPAPATGSPPSSGAPPA